MALTQFKSKRSQTGSRYISFRKKRKLDLGSTPTLTKLGERHVKTTRILGGNSRSRILSDNTVSLYDKKEKKSVKSKILAIVENPANRHFVRRNIITRGTVLETEKGKARVTSRPGQQATISAVLI
ncbi:MAG: 30S ribosomal protein S8e [archaeon]